jgi:hypothetical protein
MRAVRDVSAVPGKVPAEDTSGKGSGAGRLTAAPAWRIIRGGTRGRGGPRAVGANFADVDRIRFIVVGWFRSGPGVDNG